jgi:transcriptional/translational regulatory protein YebC/TACO1
MQKALKKKVSPLFLQNSSGTPANTVEISEEQSEEVFKLIERLEGDDDVQHVFHNMA